MPSPIWAATLLASVGLDAGATAYVKLAGDRVTGTGFALAALFGVAVYAPSIVTFGYAMKAGSSYLTTAGVWSIGVYAANAALGVAVFGDPFTLRTALGLTAAVAATLLLAG